MPITHFSPSPYLKLSGIAISLAEVHELSNQPKKAFDIYSACLNYLKSADFNKELSGREQLRAVAVASKLAELASESALDMRDALKEKAEEGNLVYAVQMVLKILASEDRKPESTVEDGTIAELSLPDWVKVTDVVAPIESLGSFYARRGRVEYVIRGFMCRV